MLLIDGSPVSRVREIRTHGLSGGADSFRLPSSRTGVSVYQ